MRKSLCVAILLMALAATYALAQTSNPPMQSTPPTVPDQDHSAGQPPWSEQPGQAEPGAHQRAKGQKPDTAQNKASDEALEHEVQRQLATDGSLADVRAEVRGNEIVTLTGSVPSKKDRDHAKQLAQSVPGVRKVKDNLKIGGAATSAAASTAGGTAGTAAQSSQSAASSSNTAGSIAGNTQSAPGSNPMEGSAETRIQNAIQTEIADSKVSVSESGNNLQLTGTVPSDKAKEQAGKIAEQYAAGKHVDNDLTIASASATSSAGTVGHNETAETAGASGGAPVSGQAAGSSGAAANSSTAVQSDIQSALRSEPSLSSTVAQNISVNVSNNHVVLSGTVPSQSDKDKAQEVAEQKAAGMSVINNIQVSSSASAAAGSTAGGVSGAAGATTPSSSAQSSAGTSGNVAAAPPQSSNSPASRDTTTEQGAPTGGATSAQNATDLKSQIENSLQKEQLTGVVVNVTDEKVELTGTVPNGKDKQTAKRIAQSYAGNRKVVDHIKVTGQGQGANMSPGSETSPSGGSTTGMPGGPANPSNPTSPSPNNPMPPGPMHR